MSLLKALGCVAERNVAEVQAVMRDFFQRDSLEAVSRAELVERLKEGAVTVLDVRPESEFALGHVPGAINVPIEQLERRLAELPIGREIVAYCRGHYRVMSFEAVAALRKKGY
ncbi:rhodanese-like domain-containing protein [Variovorax sp. MHTC-1]|uniref:rhodanese-like domain-containing protein n=1 Tax=Variovorax sp. MHTC-1 TaxID=2495593 RepID=UPI0021AE7988|nr:rhodanese-like domain-containing protein [Variovorax sp. MHTC-1]